MNEETKSLCKLFGLFFASLGMVALVLWLAFLPKKPTFVITDFSVSTSNDESGAISLTLNINNPNHGSSIFYDDILLLFRSGHDILRDITIPSFHQGRGKTRQLSGSIDVHAQAWGAFQNAISNGTAQLEVDLVTKIRYKVWGRTGKHHDMTMLGQLPIGSNGKISGEEKMIKLRHAPKDLKSELH